MDIQNIEMGDWISGSFAVLLLISLFFNWTWVSEIDSTGVKMSGSVGASGWMMVVAVLVSIVVIGVFIGTMLTIELPVQTSLVYMLAGGLALVVTILMMLIRPIEGIGFKLSGIVGSKYPWIGAFIGFIASAGVIVGGYMKSQAER